MKENLAEQSGEREAAKQQYDIARMIESELSHIDLPTATFELIDNALDETLEAHSCEIVLTFDVRDKKIHFENRNTSGMDPDKLQNFVQWGQEHTDPTKLKEHGQGGKLSILYLLSKDTGSLAIVSQAAGARKAYKMELENWWKNLQPGKEFGIKTLTEQKPTEKGFTRMFLDNVKEDLIPTPSLLASLAERIGFSYAPLIQGGGLSVTLRRLSRSGKPSETYSVLPIDIPVDPETLHTKKNVQADKGKIKMDIAYGRLDLEKRANQSSDRKGYYNVSNTLDPTGEKVRIFYGGKLIDEVELSRFKIGASRRMAFYNFVAIVNITEGFVEKTILKTGLSRSSAKTQKIYDAIKKTIEPYILEISKEHKEKGATAAERKRVEDASTRLSSTLLRLHQNDLEKIRQEFNLPSTTYVESGGKKRKVSKKTGKTKATQPGTTIRTLPGIREVSSSKETPKLGQKKELKITRATNPLPELRVMPMGETYPNAVLLRDEEENKLVIALNYNSPDVSLALQTRGAHGIAQLMRIAAWAIYHEKWVRVFENNVQDYLSGVQSDVAELLIRARKYKII